MTHSTRALPRPTATRRPLMTAVLGAAVGLAFLVASPATATASAAPPTTSADAEGPGDAEKSIVYVGVDWTGYVEYPTTDGEWAWSEPVEVHSSCTGWFASDEGHIVTAGHCVDPEEIKAAVLREFLARNDASDLEDAAGGWRVEGYEEGTPPDRTDVWVVQPSAVEGAVIEDPLTVQVMDFLPLQDGDLALLKANGLQEPTPALAISPDAPSIGDPLTAIGYPGSVMSVSDVSRLRASFKSGTVSSSQVTEHGVAGTEINAEVSAGMSGGPTIDADGQVLGVNSFGILGEEQSFNFITDGDALRSYLERQGVDLETATSDVEAAPAGDTRPAGPVAGPSAAEGALPSWTFLAGGGVLALLAGGAFLLTRRGAGQPAAAVPAFVGSTGHPARSDSTRWIDQRVPVVPVPAGASCSHTGNAPGARFCGDCGSRLTH